MTQTGPRTVRLLIVDNSPTARERLRHLFEDAPGIEVAGQAGTVERAVRLVEEVSPTAVLMDCDLPAPGSFTAVQEMMSLYPVPIIMMTKQPPPDSTLESQALETGAVALVTWNQGRAGSAATVDSGLVRKVRAMAEVKVVRRRGHSSRGAHSTSEPSTARPVDREPVSVPADNAQVVAKRPAATNVAVLRPLPPEKPALAGRTGGQTAPAATVQGARIEIVAIGASTGGPPVLQTILRGFSRPLPVPILLVQHLSRGFQSSLVSWLADSTHLRIVVAGHGLSPEPGVVYLAPDDRHLTLDASGRVLLTSDPPENASRPSVSVLFRSVAQHYGPNSIGVLLTGMGRDGAKELRLMRDKGAVTIAQDEESSVVHGMPGEAIKLKGARYVLPPDRIASVVEHHVVGPLSGVAATPSR